jgi:hypothetical protein
MASIRPGRAVSGMSRRARLAEPCDTELTEQASAWQQVIVRAKVLELRLIPGTESHL